MIVIPDVTVTNPIYEAILFVTDTKTVTTLNPSAKNRSLCEISTKFTYLSSIVIYQIVKSSNHRL